MRVVQNDLLGALLLIGILALITSICEAWTRWHHPDPELARKSVHILGGLGCLLFPFCIGSPLVVLVMALVFALFFFLGEKSGQLQCLSGVSRKSKGGEYFPLAVAALYTIAQDRLWLYFVSVLILTVADAGAAIIGSRYGKIRFQVAPGESKSLEGSLIFWSISLLVIALLLGTMTGLSWTASLLTAFLVGSLLTGIEAIAIKGTDNIFVPILTCYILLKITTKPVSEIAFQCLSFSLIFCFSLFWNQLARVFTLRDSILFTTFSYAAWSLGSVDWFLPIGAAFLLHSLLRLLVKRREVYHLETAALFRVLMIPFCILFVANWFDRYELLFGPYLMAVSMICTLGSWSFLFPRPIRAGMRSLSAALLALVLPLVIGGVNIFSQPELPGEALLFMPLLAMGLILIYNWHLARRPPKDRLIFRTAPIWLLTSMAVIGYWSLQNGGMIRLWRPDF
ncbi:MAG: hypothetical protein HGA96_16265 [Desulfobulbaceae bacterium]|nr:hypothetical protein [Desulfobulbaceae bacterium]